MPFADFPAPCADPGALKFSYSVTDP